MSYRRPLVLPLLALVLLASALLPTRALAASRVYLRAAVGHETSRDTTLRDLDCSATSPPALFGCGTGSDGRPLGARGDFGDATALELGAGLELGTRSRLELSLQRRAGLALDARANFLGVSGDQPVRADADSLAAFLVGAVDLGRPGWRLQPFAALGAGLARNRLDPVTYSFPGISESSVTITRGGTHTGFAWSAAAGLAYRLNASATLELALRTSDLGEARTDAGQATIVRPRGAFGLDVAGTRADLRTTGVTLGLRYRL